MNNNNNNKKKKKKKKKKKNLLEVGSTVEPKDLSTASIRELCPFIRGARLLRLC